MHYHFYLVEKHENDSAPVPFTSREAAMREGERQRKIWPWMRFRVVRVPATNCPSKC